MTQKLHTIHARFRLDEVTRGQGYYKAPGESSETILVEAANVTLYPVQGEPFGNYTPSGKLGMFIVNPTAAQHFFEAPIYQVYDVVLFPIHNGKSAFTHPQEQEAIEE